MKIELEKPAIQLDFSYSNFNQSFCDDNSIGIDAAFVELDKIESGEIMNQTEARMVGHYWLRDAELAPTAEIKKEIESVRVKVDTLVAELKDSKFKNILLIGIGGSALGPQFIARALRYKLKRKIFFFDNTDPEGYEDTLAEIDDLSATLSIVVSKSGGTPETYNGMRVAEYAYSQEDLDFAKHAMAITMPDSKLGTIAKDNKWIAVVPMFDWIGGRTSIWSAVGLLPLGLLGMDSESFLAGAKDIDLVGRSKDLSQNPAMLLALFWLQQTKGVAAKNMIVLPYSDRLELFSKYLQQLVMESLGKELDRSGKTVNQGITVLGNKGSTDQHSYIQQLREGPNDFFASFVKCTETNSKFNIKLDEKLSVEDYLDSFFQGTRKALNDNGRESLSIYIPQVDEYYLGALIALYERAVSFYASFVNVNAYDQPGVEAGKLAANEFLAKK